MLIMGLVSWHTSVWLTLTFAEDMRFNAMLPEASTTKITRAPALRASRLLRMSGFSTYTCTQSDEAAQHALKGPCNNHHIKSSISRQHATQHDGCTG